MPIANILNNLLYYFGLYKILYSLNKYKYMYILMNLYWMKFIKEIALFLVKCTKSLAFEFISVNITNYNKESKYHLRYLFLYLLFWYYFNFEQLHYFHIFYNYYMLSSSNISGKINNLKTNEVNNHTFCGWKVSCFGDYQNE